jgi:hypothetical protein
MISIGGIECEVVKTFRPGFVLARYDGVVVFASLENGSWELWAGSPSEEERAALTAAIETNGGFDKTSVDVIPPL